MDDLIDLVLKVSYSILVITLIVFMTIVSLYPLFLVIKILIF